MKQSELFKLACKCLLLDEHPGLKDGIKKKFKTGYIRIETQNINNNLNE